MSRFGISFIDCVYLHIHSALSLLTSPSPPLALPMSPRARRRPPSTIYAANYHAPRMKRKHTRHTTRAPRATPRHLGARCPALASSASTVEGPLLTPPRSSSGRPRGSVRRGRRAARRRRHHCCRRPRTRVPGRMRLGLGGGGGLLLHDRAVVVQALGEPGEGQEVCEGLDQGAHLGGGG